jgi:two-component system response regulator MprA
VLYEHGQQHGSRIGWHQARQRLELLVRNSGIVLDHSMIYDRIWGYDFGPESKNLAVYIGYIRRKVDIEGEKRLIHTVRGVGYTARISQS